MHDMHRLCFINRGIAVNQNGRFYQRGKSYGMETKLLVAATYLDAKEKSIDAGFGPRPVISRVASECGVGWHFVEKVEGELLTEGHIIAPKDIYERWNCPIGPGSISMDPTDWFVLYRL